MHGVIKSAAIVVLIFAYHLSVKLAENAMLTWADDKIADLIGSWLFPLILAPATLLAYHKFNTYWVNKHNLEANIPISITRLIEPGETRYSGIYPNFGAIGANGDKAARLDPPFIGIGNVYISNISLNRSVTLNIVLVIKDKDGNIRKREGTGRGPHLRVMGRDDFSTNFAKERGLTPPEYILSPVHIAPQQTVHGSLVFVISEFGFGDEKIDNHILEYYASGVINRTFTYKLEVTDVISGTTILIPVPSEGYKGK